MPDAENAIEDSVLKVPKLLASSALSNKFGTTLREPFNIMITFFLRRSVEKAFQLDEIPVLHLSNTKPLSANPPFISSAVDDIMYILSQVISVTVSTAQTTTVTAALASFTRILSSDFISLIQRKMRDECYPKAQAQGALPPEEKVTTFLVLMNNLDTAIEYIERILTPYTGVQDKESSQKQSRVDHDTTITSMFPFAGESHAVTTALRNFKSSFEMKASELLVDANQVAFHQIIKPRIRSILTETFRDTEYISPSATLKPGEEDSESGDPIVPTRFSNLWTALMAPIVRLVTPRNADRLLTTATSALANTLEKRLWSMSGRVSDVGAPRLERDVAGIVAASASKGRYGLRDAFTGCTQLCLVLCFEEEEWLEAMTEITKDSNKVEKLWVLDRDDMLKARGMLVQDATGDSSSDIDKP